MAPQWKVTRIRKATHDRLHGLCRELTEAGCADLPGIEPSQQPCAGGVQRGITVDTTVTLLLDVYYGLEVSERLERLAQRDRDRARRDVTPLSADAVRELLDLRHWTSQPRPDVAAGDVVYVTRQVGGVWRLWRETLEDPETVRSEVLWSDPGPMPCPPWLRGGECSRFFCLALLLDACSGPIGEGAAEETALHLVWAFGCGPMRITRSNLVGWLRERGVLVEKGVDREP